jgi:hypothetical protein
LVTSIDEPVSATRKLAPVRPTSAVEELLPQLVARFGDQIAALGQALVEASAHGRSRNISATCSLGEMHGRRDDVAGRLVAQLDDVFAEVGLDGARCRLASRCSLSAISSESIDFDLVTVRAPTLWHSSAMMRRASAAVGAQWTWPPRP